MTISPLGSGPFLASRKPAQTWLAWLVITAFAVALSYIWLDRPIALFAHAHLHPYDLFARLNSVPAIVSPVVIFAFAAIGLWALSERALSRLQTVTVLAVVSLAVASGVKDQLKLAFGRTWPETWVRNNPSFIRDGVYGFNPFHGGPGFAAFPSGHATAVCAVMSVLWICYPRYRALYAVCMVAVAIGLVGADLHFLSDVIAGAFLGVSTGWLTVVLWERGRHHLRSAEKATLPGKLDRDHAADFHYLVAEEMTEVGHVD
ncbi:MAG TPA: phosphatase PAP2 family protein [Xanthobacteraceae bacterium]